MDLIEKVFGIAPDGGNGAVELTILVLLLAVVGVMWQRLVRRPRRPAG
jgi:hypothetical protein